MESYTEKDFWVAALLLMQEHRDGENVNVVARIAAEAYSMVFFCNGQLDNQPLVENLS